MGEAVVPGRIERPPLWRRAAAYGVDYLSIGVFAAGLAAVAYSLGADRLALGPLTGQLLGFALLTGPVVLALSALESSGWRATPGKKVLGLVVKPADPGAADAGPLPFGRALLRNVGKFLPWELSHAAIWQSRSGELSAVAVALIVATWLLIGVYLLGAGRGSGQTLYDRLARALVTIGGSARL